MPTVTAVSEEAECQARQLDLFRDWPPYRALRAKRLKRARAQSSIISTGA